MSADTKGTTATSDSVFEWHPEYRGRTVGALTRELEAEISRDQRAYDLALMGAEDSEHDALASVVDIERRWSIYDFGWNETPAAELAQRIVAFEWAREQRQEMISWQDYRRGTSPAGASTTVSGRSAATGGDWRSRMSDDQRRGVANGLAVVILALVAIAIIAVVLAVF